MKNEKSLIVLAWNV